MLIDLKKIIADLDSLADCLDPDHTAEYDGCGEAMFMDNYRDGTLYRFATRILAGIVEFERETEGLKP